jgi:hypothetical protein
MRSIWDQFIMQLVYGYVAMSSYTPCQCLVYYDILILPACRRRVVRACRSCLPRRSSLPRPVVVVVVAAYKSATPSHTTLQHQPHPLDNHLNITSSKVRTITTRSAYHRLERAQGANIVAVLRPQSKHRTRAILGLTRPNQTTNLTDTIQSHSHHSLTTVHKTVLNIITRCFASRLHLARYVFEAPPDC